MDKKKWRCKSRTIIYSYFDTKCKYEPCIAETEFQPRGCLAIPASQEWEEVSEQKEDEDVAGS